MALKLNIIFCKLLKLKGRVEYESFHMIVRNNFKVISFIFLTKHQMQLLYKYWLHLIQKFNTINWMFTSK